jgi:hypothetical protein
MTQAPALEAMTDPRCNLLLYGIQCELIVDSVAQKSTCTVDQCSSLGFRQCSSDYLICYLVCVSCIEAVACLVRTFSGIVALFAPKHYNIDQLGDQGAVGYSTSYAGYWVHFPKFSASICG